MLAISLRVWSNVVSTARLYQLKEPTTRSIKFFSFALRGGDSSCGAVFGCLFRSTEGRGRVGSLEVSLASGDCIQRVSFGHILERICQRSGLHISSLGIYRNRGYHRNLF